MVWMSLMSSFSPRTPHICSTCIRHFIVPMCHPGSPGDVACPALTSRFTRLSADPLCMSQGPSKNRWNFEANWIKAQFIRVLGFPANAGDAGLIRESGRPPVGGSSGKNFPTQVFLPGKSHWQRSLAECSPWGHKELDTTLCLNHKNFRVCTCIEKSHG